ncbi:hypothetical protein J4404_03780 [Candidatus Woesearchaeota archaeon]|nr:hypothetical protein [Candidatus Woesearchaeota archaeon]
MDLKEYESWLYFLKEEIAHDRIEDATIIIKDLISNQEIIEDINKDKSEKIINKLKNLSAKLKIFSKEELENSVDGILTNFNELISLKKEDWKILIEKIIVSFIQKNSLSYKEAYKTGQAINNIKKINQINYKKGIKLIIWFTDGTNSSIKPESFNKNATPSDRLAIALLYFANVNNPKNKSEISGRKEIAKRHGLYGGADQRLKEFKVQLGLAA